MNSAPPKIEGPSGQILPLGLAGLVIAGLLFVFCLRMSSRLIQRERTRMRTDVTAFSGGIQYARGLNGLAATQQALAASYLTAIVTFGAASDMVVEVRDAQSALVKALPWAVEASTVYVGYENGLAVLPIWNHKRLLENIGTDMLMPDFNIGVLGPASEAAALLNKFAPDKNAPVKAGDVSRWEKQAEQSLSEGQKDRLANMIKRYIPDAKLDALLKIKGYRYTDAASGQTVQLPAESAGPVTEKSAGGGQAVRYKDYKQHRYVVPKKGIDLDLPLCLKDLQGHYLTLISLQWPKQGSPDPRPGWSFNLAQVQIAGGDMVMGDVAGSMDYNAFFVPVRLFPALAAPQLSQSLGAQHGIDHDLPGRNVSMDIPGAKALGEMDEQDAGQAAAAMLGLAETLGVPQDSAWMRSARHAAELLPDALAVRH